MRLPGFGNDERPEVGDAGAAGSDEVGGGVVGGLLVVGAHIVGALREAGLLEVLAAAAVFLCGMMTGVLPAEMLPTFWADWIQPWAPQHFVGDGVRDILYRGTDLMPHGTGGLLAIGGTGLVLLVVAGLLPRRPHGAEQPAAAPTGAEALAAA